MKKLLTYRRVRTAILIMLLVGLAALLLAGYAFSAGSVWRAVLIWIGVALYVVSLVVMFVGFRCPACGAHFFKSALFLSVCPVCGYTFSDFELGKKVSPPAGWETPQNGPGDKLPPHR